MISGCKNCGSSFKLSIMRGDAEHHSQVYCSESCQRKATYKRNALDYEWRLGKLVAMAKNRAKAKDLPFNITKNYMVKLWKEQDGKCAFSGKELVLEAGEGRVNPDAPSIDRILPELGYVKGNVRLVTYHVNVCLSEFGDKALVELAKTIAGVAA